MLPMLGSASRDFHRYYAEHRNKTVVYYYDATALGSNYAVNE